MKRINQPINSGRIDGLQLMEQKFPSLTRRQSVQAYDVAVSQGLSLADINRIIVKNPTADIGESFEITFIYNTKN